MDKWPAPNLEIGSGTVGALLEGTGLRNPGAKILKITKNHKERRVPSIMAFRRESERWNTDGPYGPSVRTVRTDGPYGPSMRTVRTDCPYGRSVRPVRIPPPRFAAARHDRGYPAFLVIFSDFHDLSPWIP